ncbi:MAG TPA: glycoside hydrolase family 2 TIM barrel-domain containing protein [Verrucomicrobiae bacterium]|nr:glycoside hydrolase family 2 TIM barrel-domain containing protein [Verrucomicrobiae bacterium]
MKRRGQGAIWFALITFQSRISSMTNYFTRARRILFAVGFLSVANAAIPVSAQETIRQYLSGTDGEHTVPWDFFCSDGRGSGCWTNIEVPSCWELQGFGKFRYGHEDKNYTSIRGDYRHQFNVPAEWSGKRVFIVFDGVMADAAVKINGLPTGPVHQGAFYRFKYDITGLVKYGQENLLEVSVDDKSSNASVNNAERNADFWVFGGIFRPVWLQAEPAQFLKRVAIDARADGTFALDYYLGGQGNADTVKVTLQDARGRMVGKPVSVPVTAGRVVTKVAAPALWTAETPVLYTAVVQLKQGAEVLHEFKQRFGFRTIEVRPGEGLFVNGQHILLRGVCHHVAWPTLGRSSSDRIDVLDIDLIRDMNMNAVRMSHYPPDEEFLDLCDEKGLYVLDELTGWQHKYDTDVGREHVKEMISRDVNHPSIIIWDNGNEGGWNTNLDADFTQLDPQHRVVNHPWAKFGDITDSHYPDYSSLLKALGGKSDYLMTEFLHGLYDGGLGAGLDDYWKAMSGSKVAMGGFLWVFADEGVQRGDSNNVIDVKGNWAPDGIVGPFRQKEASYYTIKQIWSPVQLPEALPANFNGTLPVENRFDFTSLSQCRFTWQLRNFGDWTGFEVIASGQSVSPRVGPKKAGVLKLNLPRGWKNADALAVTVKDAAGHELWTWVYPLRSQNNFTPAGSPVTPAVVDGESVLKSGDTEVHVDPTTGQLLSVKVNDKNFSLTSAPISEARWTLLNSGWLKLDYSVDPSVQTNVLGVAFDFPEEKMLKKTWLGDGPYRVWRNRLKGGTLGVWETAYNTTETGYEDWVYPEFAGYFANVHWLKLATTEGVLTMMIPDGKTFVRVGTPRFPPAKLSGRTKIAFPSGNLAAVRDIPPIGTKFHRAAQLGPQSTTPLVNAPYQGSIYLRFDPVAAVSAN